MRKPDLLQIYSKRRNSVFHEGIVGERLCMRGEESSVENKEILNSLDLLLLLDQAKSKESMEYAVP